ncbi:hypothetical protein SLEP1_g22456 [Rubroshorea leprosula]|uniref:Uncharacterized protein n=1 Tax=Rubroshorea leprosula TaxID=152421 RepID=A0AAV5J993_9ROSI|nr:hypothetical protein SLEP1_g22456 [Rubroshorea leprosula]
MGGRGRPRKKDPPPKGGAATKIIDLKDEKGEQNSISVEETNKEQTEVVKLVARDPNQMGLKIEESGRLSPDLGEKEGDAEEILLDLAVSTQGQRNSRFNAGPKDGRADKGKSEAGPVEGKVAKGKQGVRSETQPFVIQMKQPSCEKDAGSTSGNRDISKGWDLQYIKPQDPIGAVVITEDEWVKGSKIWENALVGYVLRSKPDFKDVVNYVNNKWREFQNPESLGKLASYVGVPIATDALTAKRQRVAYARMLVEMEIKDTLPRVVPIIGPKGVFQQPVVYEWEPVRCVHSATNLANVKQSTLSRPSRKLIVERNEQSPMQLEVGAMKSVNLQSETSIGTGDKEMMQKAVGGESSVNLRVIEVIQTDQLLHVEVCSAVRDVKFLCTIVYAFNTFDGRVALWDQVRALDVENVPWIISGDFNTTLNYGERVKPSGVVWGDTSELKDFVSRMEVFDLQFSSAFFTWSNKQGENDRLWCKLDRVMANSTWVSTFPNTSVVFLNPQSSDHSPSLVIVDELMNEKPRPFRFCNAWAKDENFLDLVREGWSVDIQGCPMFVVVQKLKLVKQKMKQLHKNRYGNLGGRIKDMAAELQNVQASMHNALFDETLAAKEKELQHELTKLERANLSVIAQRAKVTWLKEMDSNSAYFHAKVKERQHRSVINSIPEQGRVLTIEELEELCRPFTAKEVETALFSIPSNKSPGPDGFTLGFYRVAWSIIKNDVTAAVLDFFDSGKILKQINATKLLLFRR